MRDTEVEEGGQQVPAANLVVASRQAIAAEALRLFAARGYDQTTVADIAHAAGLSRATVFRQFGSKEDILFDRYRRQFDQVRRHVRLQRGSDVTRTRRALVALAERLEAEGDPFRLETRIIAEHDRLRAHAFAMVHDLGTVLAREIAGKPIEGLDALPARIMAHSAVTAMLEAICIWTGAKTDTALADLTKEALQLAIPGRGRASRIS